MSKLETQHDRLILRKVEVQTKKMGAILISDATGEKAETYEVLATGPGRYNEYQGKYIPTEYKVGDTVLVKRGLLHELTYDGETLYVTRDIEVLAKVSKEENL